MNKTEGPNAHDVQREDDLGWPDAPVGTYAKAMGRFWIKSPEGWRQIYGPNFNSNAFSHLKPAPKSHKIVIWSLLVFASLVTWYCVVNYGVLK